jgi:hypothetical protein
MPTIRDTRYEVLVSGISPAVIFNVNISSITPGLLIPIRSSQSPIDSTVALLAIGGIYTSPAFVNIENFSKVIGTILSNVAGTFFLQYSQNGVNVDAEESIVYPGGSVARGFEFPVVAPQARLRYVNGAVAQTSFRLFARGRTL